MRIASARGAAGRFFLASIALVSTALAQPPEAVQLRVARLIRDLGNDSFAVRKQADEELARIGPEARRQIEAATASDDPEVRLRAKDLLAQLKVADLWSAGKVTLSDRPLPASQLLTTMSKQTGNHLLVGDQFGAFHDAEARLKPGDREFWPALDELCCATGNHFRAHYDNRTPGVVLVAGPPGQQPLAYAGPVRGRVTSARRVLIEELNYADTATDTTHTFQLNLDLVWEDRFRLVAYRAQPELSLARTDTGVQLATAQSSGGGWNVASPSMRQVTMNLRLQPPPQAARELDTLALRWSLIAVGDMATLEVADLESKMPHFQDDVELVVESVRSAGVKGRFDLVVLVTRDRVLPEPSEVLVQEHELELLDADGKAFRKQSQTNTISDHVAKLKLTFSGATEASVPRTLRFHYPRVRSQRDVELVFRHVPLPKGRVE